MFSILFLNFWTWYEKTVKRTKASQQLRREHAALRGGEGLHKRVSPILCMCSALQTSSMPTYHCLTNSWPIRYSETCWTLFFSSFTASLSSTSPASFTPTFTLPHDHTSNQPYWYVHIPTWHMREILPSSDITCIPSCGPHYLAHKSWFCSSPFQVAQGRHKSVSTDHSQTLHHPSGRPGQRFRYLKTCPVLPNFDSDHRPLPIRHALHNPVLCPLHLCTLSTS